MQVILKGESRFNTQLHERVKLTLDVFGVVGMEPSQCQYAYTKDLLVLDSRKLEVQLIDMPAKLREVHTLWWSRTGRRA